MCNHHYGNDENEPPDEPPDELPDEGVAAAEPAAPAAPERTFSLTLPGKHMEAVVQAINGAITALRNNPRKDPLSGLPVGLELLQNNINGWAEARRQLTAQGWEAWTDDEADRLVQRTMREMSEDEMVALVARVMGPRLL